MTTREKTYKTLHLMQRIADRIDVMRRERIRALARRAGVGEYIGTAGHNAMLALKNGHPWEEIDYSALRAAIRIERMPSPCAITDRWYVRAYREGRFN